MSWCSCWEPGRIADLERALEDRRDRAAVLANEEAEAPPTADDLGKALDHLPVLADRLSDLPQRELRAVFESLQLQIPYQPAAAAVDVEVTLVADERSDLRGGVAEVHSVRRSSSSFEPAERSRVRRSGPKMVRIPRGSGAGDAPPRQRPRSVWARQRPDGGGGRESNPPTDSRRRTGFEDQEGHQAPVASGVRIATALR